MATFVIASWAIFWSGWDTLSLATLAIVLPSFGFLIVEWWRGQELQFWSGAWWLLHLGGLCLAAGLLGEGRPLQLSTFWQHVVVSVFALGVFPLAVRSRLEQVAPEGSRMMESIADSNGRR